MEFWILAAGLTSLGVGGVMTIFAAYVMQQNHRREAARTALLSQKAFPGGAPAEASTNPLLQIDAWDGVEALPHRSSVTDTIFPESEPSGAVSRRVAAVASVTVAFAIFGGAYWWFTTGHAAPRIELLSVSDRGTPAAFLVEGRVRNPAGGVLLRDVFAVVDVVDGGGRVLKTVRAPITQRELHAGESSEFSATGMKAPDVAGYRVSFQDAAHAVVPHVDRRPQAASSTSG